MKKLLPLFTCLIYMSLHATAQIHASGDANSTSSKKRKSFFEGNSKTLGMNEYSGGLDFNTSSLDNHVLQNPGVKVPIYTDEHYKSTAFGVSEHNHMSIIGSFLSIAESPIIIGDLLNIDFGYGRINTNDPTQKDRYLFNHGSSWFVLNYELGGGFMTNFSKTQQFGANFVFFRGSLDRSYPVNGGRTTSYTEFRYRYRRILGELKFEGNQFGLKGLTSPQIFGLSCKRLQNYTRNTKSTFVSFFSFGLEYMNKTLNNVSSDHLRMFNFRVSAGYVI